MTIYREITVTQEERDAVQRLAQGLTRLALMGEGRGMAHEACALHDIVERWDDSIHTEATFPPPSLDRYIDAVAGVL